MKWPVCLYPAFGGADPALSNLVNQLSTNLGTLLNGRIDGNNVDPGMFDPGVFQPVPPVPPGQDPATWYLKQPHFPHPPSGGPTVTIPVLKQGSGGALVQKLDATTGRAKGLQLEVDASSVADGRVCVTDKDYPDQQIMSLVPEDPATATNPGGAIQSNYGEMSVASASGFDLLMKPGLLFKVADASDPTKRMSLVLSGVTAGQTRARTVGDFNTSEAKVGGAEGIVAITDATGKLALSFIPSGSGSGLDADTLDGHDSTYFAAAGSLAAYQLRAEKDAASGYAGLTAGTKLNLAQMQEVMALADLSDVSAKTGTGSTVVMDTSPVIATPTIASFVNSSHTHQNAAGGGQLDHTLALTNIGTNSHAAIDTFIASKAAVSGLASLDGSSLVVQNPANATATPTASKIAIADGAGHLDGWITSTALGPTFDDSLFRVYNHAAPTKIMALDASALAVGTTTKALRAGAGTLWDGGGTNTVADDLGALTHLVGPSDEPFVQAPGAGQTWIVTDDVGRELLAVGGGNVFLLSQDDVSEGGQIVFNGAGAYDHVFLDNFQGKLRVVSPTAGIDTTKASLNGDGLWRFGDSNDATEKLESSGNVLAVLGLKAKFGTSSTVTWAATPSADRTKTLIDLSTTEAQASGAAAGVIPVTPAGGYLHSSFIDPATWATVASLASYATVASLAAYQTRAEKGAASGYLGLDSSSRADLSALGLILPQKKNPLTAAKGEVWLRDGELRYASDLSRAVRVVETRDRVNAPGGYAGLDTEGLTSRAQAPRGAAYLDVAQAWSALQDFGRADFRLPFKNTEPAQGATGQAWVRGSYLRYVDDATAPAIHSVLDSRNPATWDRGLPSQALLVGPPDQSFKVTPGVNQNFILQTTAGTAALTFSDSDGTVSIGGSWSVGGAAHLKMRRIALSAYATPAAGEIMFTTS